MTPGRSVLGLVAVATVLAGCGGSPPPPGPAAAPPPPVAAAAAPVAAGAAVSKEAAAATQAAAEVLAKTGPGYHVKGRRDPFANLEVMTKEREGAPAASVVSSSRLTGIVRGPGQPRALVETAQGMGYILKTGDTLGEGHVVEIGTEEIVFSVPPKPGSAAHRVVLKITKD
jgi:hypothetical protein